MKRFVIGDIHGNLKGLLQCLERSGFNKEHDLLITLGDIADGYSYVYQVVEELLTIKNRIDIRGNHDCLSENTECFTQRGWVKSFLINENDIVFGINPKTNRGEWQPINSIIRKKSNHINVYENKRVCMEITDGHRIMHRTGENYDYIKCQDLKYTDRPNIPLAVVNGLKENNSISDNELRLVAWILTDGHITKKHGYVTIYQSKEGNIPYIIKLLDELELSYTITKRLRLQKIILGKSLKSSKECYEFKINSVSSRLITTKLIASKNRLPNYLYNLSNRQLRLFLNEVIRGDGSKYPYQDNYIIYGTENFLSNIQGLFNMCGYSASLTTSKRGDFRLNVSHNNVSSIRQDLNKVERVSGTFDVWCLSVPFTNFLVRNNGKSYFTGNCWFQEWLTQGVHPDRWVQGGEGTLKSYTSKLGFGYGGTSYRGFYTSMHPTDIPATHRDFFLNQRAYYKDDENNFFVHGGFNRHYTIAENSRNRDIFWWDRDLFYAAMSAQSAKRQLKFKEEFKNIFIGHTQTTYWNISIPMFVDKVINVDTGGGWHTGKVTIMNIDTKEYWQSDLSGDLYPNEQGRK